MKNKLHYITLSLCLLLLLAACSGATTTTTGDPTPVPLSPDQIQATEESRISENKYLAAFVDATATPTLIPTPVGGAVVHDPETAIYDAWLLNRNGQVSIFTDSSGNPLLYDVIGVEEEEFDITSEEQNRGLRPTEEGVVVETPTPSSTVTVPLTDQTETAEVEEEVAELTEEFVMITTSGIPDYNIIISDGLLSDLRDRPLAATDFRDGRGPNVPRYTELRFGQDLGYATTNCTNGTQGFGYWPPTGECPLQSVETYFIPATPYERIGNACPTSITPVGLWVNGVTISSWWDGRFYDIVGSSTAGASGAWHTVAPYAESFDMDICEGQVYEGRYSHSSYPICLAQQLGDNGAQHSPILGFAVDGYPIYGPWESNNVLTKSCWKPRNYDDPSTATSCDLTGQRTCLLNDQYDTSQGTTITPFIGPSTDALLSTESGNVIRATSGIFLEDYYYDSTCTEQGHEYLDEFNGHFDEVRGYHYHVTIERSEDGTITPIFPFTVGPTYRGAIYDNSNQICFLPNENTTAFQIEFDANIDLGPIAAQLGVSPEALRNALINSGGDLAVAAASLGIGEAALAAALTGGGYVVGALRSIDIQAAAASVNLGATQIKAAARDIQAAGQTLAEAAAILGITPENLGYALQAAGYAFDELRQIDIIEVATNIRAGADELAAVLADIQAGLIDINTAAAQLGITPAELTAALAAYDIDVANLDFDATQLQTSLASTLSAVDLSAATTALNGVDLTIPAAALGLSAAELGSSIVVGADGLIDYAQTAEVLGVSEEVLSNALSSVDLSSIDLTSAGESVNLDNVDLTGVGDAAAGVGDALGNLGSAVGDAASDATDGVSLQSPIVIEEEP